MHMGNLKHVNQDSVIDGIISEEKIAELETTIGNMPGIHQVAVTVQERPKRILPVHLSNLDIQFEHTVDKEEPNIPKTSTNDTAEFENNDASLPPAVSYQGDLNYDVDDPMTMPEALQRAVTKAGKKGTLYLLPDGTQTFQSYATLMEEAQRMLGGLRKLDLQPGDPVLFQFDSNRNFVTTYWACILGGFLPTPVAVAPIYTEANAVVNRLHSAWKLLGHPLILTDSTLEGPINSLSALWKTDELSVAVVDPLLHGPADRDWYPSTPDDFILNLLTSGSTGVPKCVQHRHSTIISRIKGTNLMNGFTEDDISLNWMPLDHVGGMVMFNLRDVFLCCQHINAKVDSFLASPVTWLDWVHTHRATNTWAPNFAFALINDCEKEIQKGSWDLASMCNIMNAGEAVVSTTVHRFLKIMGQHQLPANAMYPAYGMSETSSAIVYSNMSRDDLQLGVHRVNKQSMKGQLQFVAPETPNSVTFTDVGPPIPGVSLRIVDRQNQVLPEDRIGRLQVKGPTIMAGYYQNPEANAESFVEGGWFNTGDLGFLHNGRLTVTGREKDLIIIRGANFANHELESVVESLPGVQVTYAAACAVPSADNQTDQLAIFFVPVSEHLDDIIETTKAIRTTLSRIVGLRPDFVIPVKKDEFPKTVSGKIQRAKLLQNLLSNKYDDILHLIDVREENQNTLPHWFFEKTWQNVPLADEDPPLPDGTFLVFAPESSDLSLTLVENFRKLGKKVVIIMPGNNFAFITSNQYEINPRKKDDYQSLIETVIQENDSIGAIIHAWGYRQSGESATLQEFKEEQFYTFFSVLWIVQALAEIERTGVVLSIVTMNGHLVKDGDVMDYQKSCLGGLLQTIAMESAVDSAHIIDLWPNDPNDHVQQICQEMRVASNAVEVAYRDGLRYLQRLTPLAVREDITPETVLTPGGIYLMIGGLGGIGFELAQYLLAVLQLKLIIVGRTPISEEDQSEIAERYRDLTDFGNVIYRSLDITDETMLHSVIQEAEEKWKQTLAGVLHLAGESIRDYWQNIHEHTVRNETIDNFLAMFQAKVFGTWTLHQVLKDRPDVVFILFSSVNGTFGGSSFSTYAAANSFLDGFARYRSLQLQRPTQGLAWTMWSDVGMNRRNPAIDAAIYRGFRPITISQGLASFLVGLNLNLPHVLIGLDSSKIHIQNWLATPEPTEDVVVIYFSAETEQFPVTELRSVLQTNEIIHHVPVRFIQRKELPTDASGKIDKTLLINSGDSKTPVTHKEPASGFEKEIASIWGEVLDRPHLGLQDSFFELGGSSLQALQIMARISAYLGTQQSIQKLYQFKTLGKLTNALQQTEIEEVDAS